MGALCELACGGVACGGVACGGVVGLGVHIQAKESYYKLAISFFFVYLHYILYTVIPPL